MTWDGTERRADPQATPPPWFRQFQIAVLVIAVGTVVGLLRDAAGVIWQTREAGVATLGANVVALSKQLDATEKYFQAETNRLDREGIATKKDIEHFKTQINEIRGQLGDTNTVMREIRDALRPRTK